MNSKCMPYRQACEMQCVPNYAYSMFGQPMSTDTGHDLVPRESLLRSVLCGQTPTIYSHSMAASHHSASEEQSEALDLSTKGSSVLREEAMMKTNLKALEDKVRPITGNARTPQTMTQTASEEATTNSYSSPSLSTKKANRNIINPPMVSDFVFLRRLLSKDDFECEHKQIVISEPVMTGSSPVELTEDGSCDVHPAHMTDHFIESVSFAQSFPEFQQLFHSDQIILMQNAWCRLVLLNMAQNDSQFQVQHVVYDEEDDEDMTSFTKPTLKSARAIQMFIEKCQSIGISYQEYNFLKLLTIFNSGTCGFSLIRCLIFIITINIFMSSPALHHWRLGSSNINSSSGINSISGSSDSSSSSSSRRTIIFLCVVLIL